MKAKHAGFVAALALVLALGPGAALAAGDTTGATEATGSTSATGAKDATGTADKAAEVYTTASTKASSGTQGLLEDGAVYLISTSKAARDAVVLDVARGSTAAGANVQLYRYNATLAQFWRAVYKGDGVYNFVAHKGTNMLAWRGGASSGANVVIASSGNVDWKVLKNNNGTYSLVPASNENVRLDIRFGRTSNGTNVQLYTANATPAQEFYFTKAEGLTAAYKTGKAEQPRLVEIALTTNDSLRTDVPEALGGNGANAQVAADSKAFTQKFRMNYVGNGLYEFVAAVSGKALDVAGGSKAAGANVWQYARNQTLAQYWYLVKDGGGYSVRSALGSNALSAGSASAGANLRTAKAASGATQRFSFKTTQIVDNGTYVVQSNVVAAMVLDVAGGSKADRANLQTYRSNGTDAQKFTFRHVGGGAYTIQNVKSGKYLDVRYGSTASGANVWQYAGNGTDAQKWVVELGSGGSIRIKSVKSGKYLDVAGGSALSKTNVQQYAGNGANAQAWTLHDASWRFYPTSTNLSDLRILTKAEEYEGWRYQWGGRSPATSFDCAGLVMYCANVVWGMNYDLMYTNADRLYNLCTPVAAKDAKVGDFVFYRGTYGSDVNYISHVVLYAGRGVMYGAGDPIGYAKVDSIRNIKGNKATILYARARR